MCLLNKQQRQPTRNGEWAAESERTTGRAGQVPSCEQTRTRKDEETGIGRLGLGTGMGLRHGEGL